VDKEHINVLYKQQMGGNRQIYLVSSIIANHFSRKVVDLRKVHKITDNSEVLLYKEIQLHDVTFNLVPNDSNPINILKDVAGLEDTLAKTF
jgi:hypothetical protein